MDLSGIAAIDQHAHSLARPEVVEQTPYTAAFSEGHDPAILNYHARHTLCFRRSLRDMAALLDCDPQVEAIAQRRSELGLEAVTRLCLEAANLSDLIVDDGFMPGTLMPLEWHRQFAPTHRLLRLEWLAEQMLPQVSQFEIFLEWFRSELDQPPPDVVGFKSIAAYRSGLDLHDVSIDLARDRFDILKYTYGDQPFRLTDKLLIDFLVQQALEIAALTERPVQFHTGFGDPDLDLRLANPLHLRPILEDPRYRAAPVVLLHAAYPFTREAAYLSSVYPQVYVDFGLAVPYLSVAGMRQAIAALLELSPLSKIMYASDAHLIPDLYYLGAKWGRDSLATVLEQAIADGDLTAQEAEEGAIAILQHNARKLYRL